MNVELDGYLIRIMSSLYNGSKVCMRLDSRVKEHFEVRRGLRKGCVMSPWLFNIVSEKVVRQVNREQWGRE